MGSKEGKDRSKRRDIVRGRFGFLWGEVDIGYPGRYYTVLRNTPVIPEVFGVKIESVAVKNGSPKQV